MKNILMGTDQATLKDQERIRNVLHLQSEAADHPEDDNQESGNALNVEISELVSLGQDAMDQGILDPRVCQARRSMKFPI